MTLKAIVLSTSIVAVTVLSGCGGSYSGGGVSSSVGVGLGFYESTFGHSWGHGYYRGYDSGVRDAVETIEAIETIDAIDRMGGDVGMPDIDIPDLDLGY